MKYYICKHCGNLVEMVNESGVPMICCGEPMTELVPNNTDGAFEKHVPVVSINGNNVHVNVGGVEHPMTPAHYIQWITVETNKGVHKAKLNSTDKPEADFVLVDGEKVLHVYEYCNLHGLWVDK